MGAIMKTINFSAVEILPALLDKSKTQTIRKAKPLDEWECEEVGTRVLGKEMKIKEKYEPGTKSCKYKPPRFKVGEKARLYWKQRSQYMIFCKYCGAGIIAKSPDFYYTCGCKQKFIKDCFNKILGESEITEVFEIEIGYFKGSQYIDGKDGERYYLFAMQKENLPKSIHKTHNGIAFWERDGFKSAEDMFNWFDKAYDLSSAPKKFHVYRWKYV